MVEYRGGLDHIEAAIGRIRVPLTFFGEAYKLKEDFHLVRAKLPRLNDQAREAHP
jgi:hypothetical protein